MFTITNGISPSKGISILTKDEYYQITIPIFWFFSPQQFQFTLEKTFKIYNPSIVEHQGQWIVQMPSSFLLGDILQHFYFMIDRQWLYY
jgi:hypothetical protein